jgi:hypothetical protein
MRQYCSTCTAWCQPVTQPAMQWCYPEPRTRPRSAGASLGLPAFTTTWCRRKRVHASREKDHEAALVETRTSMVPAAMAVMVVGRRALALAHRFWRNRCWSAPSPVKRIYNFHKIIHPCQESCPDEPSPGSAMTPGRNELCSSTYPAYRHVSEG